MSKASEIIILTGSLTLALIGVAIIFCGLHNIDAGWNLNYINSNYKLGLVESNVSGEQWTATDVYNQGVAEIMSGTLVLVFFLILYFRYYIYLMEKKHEEQKATARTAGNSKAMSEVRTRNKPARSLRMPESRKPRRDSRQ